MYKSRDSAKCLARELTAVKRCQKKSLRCTSDGVSPQQIPSSIPAATLVNDATVTFPTPPDIPSPTDLSHDADTQPGNEYLVEPFSVAVDTDPQGLHNLENDGYIQGPRVPTFFEQIAVSASDYIGIEVPQVPLDLMTWMPDIDCLGEGDLFSNDFTPTIDQTFEAQRVLDEFFVELSGPKDATTKKGSESAKLQKRQDAARMRHEIFQRSPW